MEGIGAGLAGGETNQTAKACRDQYETVCLEGDVKFDRAHTIVSDGTLGRVAKRPSGRSLDQRQFGEVFVGGKTDLDGSSSRDDGGVGARSPFRPRAVIHGDILPPKPGQSQAKNCGGDA